MPHPLTEKVCETCGDPFALKPGRGWNNRVSCYTCTETAGYKAVMDRNKNLKRSYGITLFAFSLMFSAQLGQCVTCETPLSYSGADLRTTRSRPKSDPCVDHCHTTGKVRGILCHPCNVALGHVQDKPEVLTRMIAYLDKEH